MTSQILRASLYMENTNCVKLVDMKNNNAVTKKNKTPKASTKKAVAPAKFVGNTNSVSLVQAISDEIDAKSKKPLSKRDQASLAKKARIEAKAAARAAAPAQTAPITVPADMGANAKFPFAVLCIAAKDGGCSYERFKTAKERNARLRVLEADKTLTAARPEDYKPAEAPAPAPAKADKPAKAAKAPKAPKAPAEAVLKVRLYAKGEFYFGRHVAARMAGMTHVAVEADGRKVTLTPTKSTKDTFPLMYCHKAPVLRVKEALKDLGIVTVATQDMIAKPAGETAFTVEVK